MSTPTKKRVFMYGQWVEVSVYPARPTPEPDCTVQPMRRSSSIGVDPTVTATPSSRRGRKASAD